VHSSQPSEQQAHEIKLLERRIERKSETRRLEKLKERLRYMAKRTQLARAS
jgi:hypothetical protein